MAVKAVIFDFDGVIVDSEVRFLKVVEALLDRFGEKPLENELLTYTGTPPAEMLKQMRRRHPSMAGFTPEELYAYLRQEYEKSGHLVDIMPGIKEFFDYLKENGIRTALATSRDQNSAFDMMRKTGLDLSFDILVTHNDITKGKPHPETYLKVIGKFAETGVRPEELVVLEDSRNGIAAAKGAGLFTIGFKGSKVVQDTSEADIELSSYREVKEYLARQRSE